MESIWHAIGYDVVLRIATCRKDEGIQRKRMFSGMESVQRSSACRGSKKSGAVGRTARLDLRTKPWGPTQKFNWLPPGIENLRHLVLVNVTNSAFGDTVEARSIAVPDSGQDHIEALRTLIRTVHVLCPVNSQCRPRLVDDKQATAMDSAY